MGPGVEAPLLPGATMSERLPFSGASTLLSDESIPQPVHVHLCYTVRIRDGQSAQACRRSHGPTAISRRATARAHLPYEGIHTEPTLKRTTLSEPVVKIAVMTSMQKTFRQALETALAGRETVSIRSTLIKALEREPAKAEISAANKAARKIAEEGDAVLISLLPDQAGADAYVPAARGAGRRASNYLTVDKEIIKELPCRVEFATEKWDAVIDEGMRLTQQRIESDPTLSALLPNWGAKPHAEERARLMARAARVS